ncbi:helix-turn-helix domain-containing protein, partial [Ottowia sp.]|uniref:helix-turn-helix domain-containing protein n=1 Tax=Ottowia sp. TaxID=1898956 RepID=UPI0025CF0140
QRGTAPPELTPDALALLSAQHWRGNIRELRNVLEQAALHAESDRLDAAHMEAVLRLSGLAPIQPALPPAAPPSANDETALLQPLAEQVRALEQRAIAAALRATGGNKLAAARRLGISRATLYERLGAG